MPPPVLSPLFAATVQLNSEREPPELSIPPPVPVPAPLTALLAMVELTTLMGATYSYSPAPAAVPLTPLPPGPPPALPKMARLELTVEESRVRLPVASWRMPPP